MSKGQPLWHRLYYSPACTAVARLVGYAGLLETAFWDHYSELCKKHGQQAMSAAVDAIVQVEKTATPPFVRLSPEARKLCWQLLGPAPEEEEKFYTNRDGTPMVRPVKEESPKEPPPEQPTEPETKPKRARKKK